MSMGMNYDDAHILANRVEGKVRKSPVSELDELIKGELERVSNVIPERSHFNGTLKLHVDGTSHHDHHKKISRNERLRGNGIVVIK